MTFCRVGWGSVVVRKKNLETRTSANSFLRSILNMATTPNLQQRELEEANFPKLPSVNERLGHLRPSRELLEYYRRKIAEYDDEHEERWKLTYGPIRFFFYL